MGEDLGVGVLPVNGSSNFPMSKSVFSPGASVPPLEVRFTNGITQAVASHKIEIAPKRSFLFIV
jgi:hypothetical protein